MRPWRGDDDGRHVEHALRAHLLSHLLPGGHGSDGCAGRDGRATCARRTGPDEDGDDQVAPCNCHGVRPFSQGAGHSRHRGRRRCRGVRGLSRWPLSRHPRLPSRTGMDGGIRATPSREAKRRVQGVHVDTRSAWRCPSGNRMAHSENRWFRTGANFAETREMPGATAIKRRSSSCGGIARASELALTTEPRCAPLEVRYSAAPRSLRERASPFSCPFTSSAVRGDRPNKAGLPEQDHRARPSPTRLAPSA